MVRPPISLRAKALALLASREYSRLELARKLKAHARRSAKPPADDAADGVMVAQAVEIEALLDELAQRGWLSEARYVEQAVNRLSRRYGPRRVIQSLEAKGIGKASAEAALPYLKTEALATARALVARRFKGPIQSAEDKARRIRFLQGRGFDYDVIRKALAEPLDDTLTDTEPGH
jgi:regulatory protein